MKSIATALILLTIVCSTLALGIIPFAWTTNHHHQTQEPRVVEIIRWRQSVCLQPAPGVSSCLLDLRRLEKQYMQTKGKGGAETKEEYSLLTESIESSSEEEQDEVAKKLVSPELVATLPLEYLQSSQTEEFETLSESGHRTTVLTEEQERNVRDGKYLVPPVERLINPRQQIYVTKVVESPVTATLVAYNCLPDIGVPLCEPQQYAIRPSAPSYAWRPTLTVTVNQDIHKKRPAGVWQVIKEPLQGEAYLGSIREAVDNSGQEIVIKKSDNDQSLTKFGQEGQRIDGQPGLQHVEISNEDKSGLSYVVGESGVSSGNRLPANVDPFDGTKFEGSSLSTQQQINVEFIRNAGNVKEDSKIVDKTSRNNSTAQQEHPILQAIHGLVKETENSDIVKRIQNFLHGDDEKSVESQENKETGVAGFLSKFRPANLFNREHVNVGSIEAGTEVNLKPNISGDRNVVFYGQVQPEISVGMKPEVAADIEAVLSANEKSVNSEDVGQKVSVGVKPELYGQARPEISVGTKPEIAADYNAILPLKVDTIIAEDVGQKISVEVKPEFDKQVQPEISIGANQKALADIETVLSASEESGISEDAREKMSTEVRQEFFVKMMPENSTDVKSEIAANIEAVLSTNEKSIISEDAEHKISTEVRPEYFVKMMPEISTDVKPEVAAESSASVKSHFSADLKSEVPVDMRTESLADVKAEISTAIKPEFSAVINPEVSMSTREEGTEISLDTKTVLPVRKIVQASDDIINEKTIETAEVAMKGTGTITKVLDKSLIDTTNLSGILDTIEKTQDIVYEKPTLNQSVLASLLPIPAKLLKNENEK